MGTFLELASTLVSPCEKLIVAVQNAIGKAYEPRYIKRMADAKAYEISTVGQAMRESSDIPIVYEKGEISLDTTNFDEFVKRTGNRLAYQELTKQKNIESVANQAYLLLEDQPPVENKPLDMDWLLRFFNSVQDVGNIEMQELWAKILAGEVLSPGTVSLRTLSILAQMSSSEARLFENFAKYVLHCRNKPSTLPDDYFVFASAKLEGITKISFAEIFLLDEIGLLSSNSLVSIDIEVAPYSTEYIWYGDKRIITIKNDGELTQKINRSAYILTTAGRELLKVISAEIDDHNVMLEYFKECIGVVIVDELTMEKLTSDVEVVLE